MPSVALLPGDAAFHRDPKGIVPKLIRWCEREKYPAKIYGAGSQSPAYWNHTFLVETADGGIIEANPGGVERADIRKYAGRGEVAIYRPPHVEHSVATMQSMLGAKYADTVIVSDLVYLVFKTTLRFGFKGHFTCSGSLARALAADGWSMGDDEAWDSPADVAWATATTPGWAMIYSGVW